MEQNNQPDHQLSFNFVYQREVYQRCRRCNECLKAIIFTEIIVTLIALIFYSVVFAISYSKLTKLSYHLTILALSGFIIFGYLISFLLLKRNFPSERNSSCKRVTILYFEVVILIMVSGAIILGKLIVDFKMIVEINENRDTRKINYDWLLFYLDFLFSIIGLQLLTSLFSLIVLLMLLLTTIFSMIHTITWLCSGKKKSLFSQLWSTIEKLIEQRKYKWQKILIRFKTQMAEDGQNREDGCPICCEEFSTGESIYELPCIKGKPLHFFHTKCLDIWSRSSAACPTCRTHFSRLVKA